jgi:hypothetical protein
VRITDLSIWLIRKRITLADPKKRQLTAFKSQVSGGKAVCSISGVEISKIVRLMMRLLGEDQNCVRPAILYVLKYETTVNK